MQILLFYEDMTGFYIIETVKEIIILNINERRDFIWV